jgi:hypothetical protein
MRQKRTELEDWVIAQLLSLLAAEGENWTEDPLFHDAPDLVLEDHANGQRVACEITTVGLNEWHRWTNDSTFHLDVNELDEIVCPREPDYWLRMVLQSKNPKVPQYLTNARASEAWLVVHGDMHDFFVLDDDYDVPVMQAVASSVSHPFARIYVASPRSKTRTIAKVHPFTAGLPNPPDLRFSANIKAMQIRSVKLDASKGGVIKLKIGEEFKPDRQLILPMLDKTRR